jgi:surface antigen
MRLIFAACLVLSVASPVLADPINQFVESAKPQRAPLQTHWECVPIARALSGIQIFGNASTWWDQADGRFERGHAPKRGAVLTFKPYGSMRLGHVATVSRIVDDRTILVTHSNWSLINGRRGQIERNVKVIDVSPENDWTSVRVWYAPLADLGGTVWPVHGFIYPGAKAPMVLPEGAGAAAVMKDIIKRKIDSVPQAGLPARPSSAQAGERPTASKALPPEKTFKPTGRLDYLEKLLPKLK